MSISSEERGSAAWSWMYTTAYFWLFLWEKARKHLPNYHVIVCDTLSENRQEDERALACERTHPPTSWGKGIANELQVAVGGKQTAAATTSHQTRPSGGHRDAIAQMHRAAENPGKKNKNKKIHHHMCGHGEV